MVLEAPLEPTEHGLFAADAGWFVLNMREVRWFDRAALRHGAGVEKETRDADEAYARISARFPNPGPMPYRDGWLPDSYSYS